MIKENMEKDEKIEEKEIEIKEKPRKIGCPVCGDTENLVPTGRCVTCLSCGWSKCSL